MNEEKENRVQKPRYAYQEDERKTSAYWQAQLDEYQKLKETDPEEAKKIDWFFANEMVIFYKDMESSASLMKFLDNFYKKQSEEAAIASEPEKPNPPLSSTPSSTPSSSSSASSNPPLSPSSSSACLSFASFVSSPPPAAPSSPRCSSPPPLRSNAAKRRTYKTNIEEEMQSLMQNCAIDRI